MIELIFEASVITNLDDVPPEYLEHVRAQFEARRAESDTRAW